MRKRIMIVEDEPVTALGIKTNVESFGYDVVAIESSGRDAIESALNLKPDLIIMDITLSDDIDGIEAINQISNHLDIPYIYITAHIDEMTINKAKETAPYGYLSKPFDIRILKNTIDFAFIRHEIALKIKESETRFSQLANSTPAIIWMCDEKGQTTFINDQYTKYTGVSIDEINTKGFYSFIHPDDADNFIKTHNDALTNPLRFELQYRLRNKGGDYRYFMQSAEPVFDNKERFAGYIASCMDIHQRVLLEENVRRLSFVVEHGPAVVVITDINAKIEYVNPRFYELTGYTSEEVIGKNPRILQSGFTPQETYEELWQTISTGAIWRGELCNKKKSGELYWELAIISPLYDTQGRVQNFVAIKEDITDKKIKQIELERRSKILEFFYKISNSFIKEESLQESLNSCADAMCEHLGAVIARIWLVDTDGSPTLAASRQCKGSKSVDFKHQIPPSAKVKEIIKTKEPYMTNNFASDTTISGRQYAAQLNCNSYIGFPLMIYNEVIGVLSMFSDKSFDQFTIETIRGSADTMAVGIMKKQIETELKAKNKMLEDINQELRDVALREFKLREEKEQMLIQQSKMASMGEMLGMIAHQWRQPLNAIALLVQNLEDIDCKTEEDKVLVNETIQNTMKQVDFMSKTINDFRDFLRPHKDIVTFNPCKYVRDVLSMIQSQLKINNVRVILKCDDNILLKGSPNEFMHVILNVINNSKDAITDRRAKGGLGMLQEGIINIEVFMDTEKDKTTIKISDNGGGIPDDLISKVFDPYFTTKHTREGTGLGLYMVKTIVEKHLNGTVSVKNIQEGFEITITI